jgi:predicted alpha/beta-hydrolase family hydrolase
MGKPSSERADHLSRISVPMLFLQGSRDKLADLGSLRPVCEKLGRKVRLHVIEDGDHSFHVRKSSGRTDEQVLDQLGFVVSNWIGEKG